MSRGRVTHPKCGKSYTNSDRVGHCGACCETIFGLRAFDEHRKNGSCLPLENGKHQFWQDRNGDWHWGPRRKESTYL